MTNENKIDNIKSMIEQLEVSNGASCNVTLLREAYHGCDPGRPHGWDCDAVQIEGHTVHIGKVSWDFEEDLEDASDYDWSFEESDFAAEESCDLEDEDEADDLIETLAGWLKR